MVRDFVSIGVVGTGAVQYEGGAHGRFAIAARPRDGPSVVERLEKGLVGDGTPTTAAEPRAHHQHCQEETPGDKLAVEAAGHQVASQLYVMVIVSSSAARQSYTVRLISMLSEELLPGVTCCSGSVISSTSDSVPSRVATPLSRSQW